MLRSTGERQTKKRDVECVHVCVRKAVLYSVCVCLRLSGLYPLYALSRQRSQTELIGSVCVSGRLEVVVEADSSCCHFLSDSGMFTLLMRVKSSDTHTPACVCTHTHTQELSIVLQIMQR